MNTTTKVAVIGLGNIGTAVATNLVKGSRTVIVADRTIAKANALAQQLGSLAQPLDIFSAIKQADIIVLAIWFNGIKEVFQQYAVELEGRIILDPSNPIAADENGGFKKIIGQNESAGELLAAVLPKNAKLVKALGTLGVASLTNAAFQQPTNVLFYATDDTNTIAEAEQLIHDTGFDPVRIGGINQSIRIEVFGDLHEFGALGKTVTKAEVKELAESAL